MTWTAPKIDRTPEPSRGDERTSLEGWLDWHRQTLLWKCAGLTAEQLKARSVEPSTLSLLGLVRHMADVERSWFARRFAGADLPPIYFTDDNPDGDLHDLDTVDAATVFATFHAEVERARRAAAGRSLDETFVHPRTQVVYDLRWVYLHMIEEYARHNGHADLIRERIDGNTGD
ncbi:DinB family protein [Actinomycetes bacterium KLBMP 9797]